MSHSEKTPQRNRRLRRADASVYLRDKWDLSYGENTLAKLASNGGGPPMEYAGRIPLYPEDGLDTWAAKKISPRVNSTAEFRRLQAA